MRGKLLKYSYRDPQTLEELGGIDGRKVEVAAQLELIWRDDRFNVPGGKETRFILMTDQGWGWKIEGLFTGP